MNTWSDTPEPIATRADLLEVLYEAVHDLVDAEDWYKTTDHEDLGRRKVIGILTAISATS